MHKLNLFPTIERGLGKTALHKMYEKGNWICKLLLYVMCHVLENAPFQYTVICT